MRNFLTIALAAAIGLASCNKPKDGTTASGDKYTIFKGKSSDGKKLTGEDWAKVQIYQYMNDSLTVSTRKLGKAEMLRLPKEGEQPGRLPSFIEALKLISVGDSIIIHENMDSIKANIPPQYSWVKDISYHVVMEQIISKEERQKQIDEERAAMEAKRAETQKMMPEIEALVKTNLAAFTGKTLGDKLKTTPSGLQYVILSDGDGDQIKAGERVKVMYYGSLMDGKMFDNSYMSGQPFELEVGGHQVITGWDEGLQLFKRGTKALLFIPYELAYGEQGNPPTIPAKAMLCFHMDIQK